MLLTSELGNLCNEIGRLGIVAMPEFDRGTLRAYRESCYSEHLLEKSAKRRVP